MTNKIKKRVFIVGASGFASELTEYLDSENIWDIQGYFDINDSEYSKYEYKAPFLGNENDYKFCSNDNVTIAIADYNIRKKIYSDLKNKNVNFPVLTQSKSFISQKAQIGEGSIICPFVTINSNAIIGVNFQANIYSYVAHDCVVGDNVTFAPSVKCNGNVVIEDDVYIGTGAIIFQGKPDKPIVIGKGAVVAAGSVVTKSIPPSKTFFGNPAVEFTRENIKRRL